MGPAASLAREKGDGTGSRVEGEGCSLVGGGQVLAGLEGCQMLRENSGCSGSYNSECRGFLFSLVYDRIGGRQCR